MSQKSVKRLVASHGYQTPPPQTFASGSPAKIKVSYIDFSDDAIRRYERGFSTTYEGIQSFLADRGFDLIIENLRHFTITQRKTKKIMAKRCKWGSVLDFTDEIRLSEGLEPIQRRNAA